MKRPLRFLILALAPLLSALVERIAAIFRRKPSEAPAPPPVPSPISPEKGPQ